MYMHCFLVCIMLCTGMLHSALRLSCKKSTFLAAAQSLSTTSAPTNTCNQSKHLVVLSHGLMGTAKDLTYLATKLQQRGFTVLTSQCNELFRSYQGIAKGAERLVEEVHQIKKQHPDLARVSFVGNSLGGLYVRYAISLLHNQTEGTIAGLQPAHFMVSPS